MSRRICILSDGEEPIIVSGLGNKFQVPRSKDTASRIKLDESWTFSPTDCPIPFTSGEYSYDSVRSICAFYIKTVLVDKCLERNEQVSTFLIYEIWADLDTRKICFDVEIELDEIELDLEDSDNVLPKKQQNISNLISYERKRIIKVEE